MQYCSLGLMKADCFPSSIDYAPVNTNQDTVGVPCCQSTLLAHIQLVLCKDPQVPFCRATTQPVTSQPSPVQWVTPAQVQHQLFVLAELCKAPVNPFLQLAQVYLDRSPVLKGTDSSPHPEPIKFHVSSKPDEHALNSITFQMTDKVLTRQILG